MENISRVGRASSRSPVLGEHHTVYQPSSNGHSGLHVRTIVIPPCAGTFGVTWQARGRRGVSAQNIQPGSEAALAGVRAGDVIVAIDGRSVRGTVLDTVARILRERLGHGMRMEVEPGEFVHTFAVVKGRASDPLGVGIIEQPTVEGAVRCIVANVAHGSPAYATGLRPGFNILSIDGHHVEYGTLAQIRAALSAGGIRVVITAKLLHDKWCCLIPFAANNPGYYCDECGTPVPQGSQLYGCVDCNHDVCKSCRAKGRPPAYSPRLPVPNADVATAAVARAGASGAVAGRNLPPAAPVARYGALDWPPSVEAVAAAAGSNSAPDAGRAACAASNGNTIRNNTHSSSSSSSSSSSTGSRRRLPVPRMRNGNGNANANANTSSSMPSSAAAPSSASSYSPFISSSSSAAAAAVATTGVTAAAAAAVAVPAHLENTAVHTSATNQTIRARSGSFVSGGASCASGNSLASAMINLSFTSARTEEERTPSPRQNTRRTSNAAYHASVAAAANTFSRRGGADAAAIDDDGAGPADDGTDGELLHVDESDGGEERVGSSSSFLSRWGKGNATRALKEEQKRRKKLLEKARKEQRQQRARLAVLEEQAAVDQRRAATTAESISQFQNDGTLVCVGVNFEVVPEVLAKAYGDIVTRLDLSFNKLTSLDGIEKFETLEELVLDNNSLDHTMNLELLTDLSALSVNNNKIADLHAWVRSLTEHCPNLTFLSMVKNEACPHFAAALESSGEYELYRHYIIYALKNLKFLDSRAITAQERFDAALRFKNASRPAIRPIKECIQGMLKPWSTRADANDVADRKDGVDENGARGLEVTVPPSPARAGISLKAMFGIENSHPSIPVATGTGTGTCTVPDSIPKAAKTTAAAAAVVPPAAPTVEGRPKAKALPTAAAAYREAKALAKPSSNRQAPTLASFFAPSKSKARIASKTFDSGRVSSVPRKGNASNNTDRLGTTNATTTTAAKREGNRKPLSQNTGRIDTVI